MREFCIGYNSAIYSLTSTVSEVDTKANVVNVFIFSQRYTETIFDVALVVHIVSPYIRIY